MKTTEEIKAQIEEKILEERELVKDCQKSIDEDSYYSGDMIVLKQRKLAKVDALKWVLSILEEEN